MSWLPWFDEAICMRLMVTLGHFLWQGLAVGIVALVATMVLRRRSARLRYAVLLGSFLAMTTCPVVTLVVLEAPRGERLTVKSLQNPPPSPSEFPPGGLDALDSLSQPPVPEKIQPGTGDGENPTPVTPHAATTGPIDRRATGWSDVWQAAIPYLLQVYFCGVLLLVGRLMLGLHGGWRLRRGSRAICEPTILETIARQAKSLGLRATPAVMNCGAVFVPTVVGVFRPVILLPVALASGLSPDQLAAVLTHELAHIRRWDHVVNVFQRVIEALLFFHPAVWWLSRQLQIERENCCDDLVIGLGAEPVSYAASLLDIAEIGQLSGRPQGARVIASLQATGDGSQLGQRVRRLLTGTPPTPLRLNRGGLTWLLTVVALITASATYLSLRAQADSKEKQPPTSFAGELPGGTTVELLGVSEHPSRPDSWWKADGSPLMAAPYGDFSGSVRGDTTIAREFALRITKLPPGATTTLKIPQSAAMVTHGADEKGLIACAVTLPEDQQRTTLRVGIASKQWTTAVQVDKQGEVTSNRQNEVLKASDFKVARQDGKLTLAFNQSREIFEKGESRVVAVDHDGKTHGDRGMSASGVSDGIQRSTFRFEIDDADITGFRLQTRIFHSWVVFENVSLLADKTTRFRVRTESSKKEPAKDKEVVPQGDTTTWSEPDDDGIQFRLRAPRTIWQSWELPTLSLEMRNSGDANVAADRLRAKFATAARRVGLLFLYGDHRHKTVPRGRSFVLPTVRFPIEQFEDLAKGESATVPVTLAAVQDSRSMQWKPVAMKPGRHVLGLGRIGNDLRPVFRTKLVELQILPTGVRAPMELTGHLNEYTANGHRLQAGFIPNKKTVVWGEPMFVSLVVNNLEAKPIDFDFGGDYRGVGRHNRFKIEVRDTDGQLLPDPMARGGAVMELGGLSMQFTAQARDMVTKHVALEKFRTVPGPGEYSVRCEFALETSWTSADTKKFKVSVTTEYRLIVLPRSEANVRDVLDKMFIRCEQTSGSPLNEMVETICSFGRAAAVPGLTKMMDEGRPVHRIAAIRGLGRITTKDSLTALLRAERDTGLDVRQAALTSLGAFTDDLAVGAVVKSLADSRQSVRAAAASALGRIKSDAAIDALTKAMGDSDPAVGVAVLQALGATQSPRAFDVVARALDSELASLRRAAVDAMANLPVGPASETLQKYATDDDMDFREYVVRKLAESLKQPIDSQWLVPVVKSRKNANSIGDVPRLLRLYTGSKAVPALLSCLDFENPAVRNYYNMTIISNQLPCRGGLAVPWIADLNRDGTAEELEQNRRTLRILKAWVDHYHAHPKDEPPLPWRLPSAEEEKTWSDPVDDLSIRVRTNHTVWPEGLEQVLSIESRSASNGGSLHFATRPDPLEAEVNGIWYERDPQADLKIGGEWHAYHSRRHEHIQLDGRWRRKDNQAKLNLKPGKYQVRVRLSTAPKDKRTGLVISKPIQFEVVSSQLDSK